MTSLLDGQFISISRIKTTHVLITGIYGKPGVENCLHPDVWPRCKGAGIDWSKVSV
jgi:hypothetical protein